ncbi:hypothetical protein TrVE_jg5990 [Triparma verrucosa]|uniref:Uncharacterized protein n=1 Tax=Triparma verrucosa TaxID=1606542 RepID=A0A9W7BQA7_9STRA|nr:hypothetical protein TrVE_jg5990 [Triparma verrucosa]
MVGLRCGGVLEKEEEMIVRFNVEGRLRNVNDIEPFINRGLDLPKFEATFYPREPFTFEPFTITSNAGFIRGIYGDGSMVFNVVTLTCTVVAFLVGTVFNVVGRRGGKDIKVKLGLEQEESKFLKLKEKLKRLTRRKHTTEEVSTP